MIKIHERVVSTLLVKLNEFKKEAPPTSMGWCSFAAY